MPSSRVQKLALLSALYLAQGLPFGFQVKALDVFLRESGLSLREIGFASLLALPWMVKALWAPLVDRYWIPAVGRRRSWILPCLAFMTLVSLSAASVATGELPPWLALPQTILGQPPAIGLILVHVFLLNLFAATMDIAVDGLAVETLQEQDLGLGNSAQVVGYKVGMLLGGGGLVYLAGDAGWPTLFAAMAGILALVFGIMLFVREPRRDAPELDPQQAADPAAEDPPSETLGQIVWTLGKALVAPGGLALLAFIFTYKTGETLVDKMYNPFLVDSGFTREQIGAWAGTWGLSFSIAGSLLGGALASALPLWRALAITAVLRAGPMFLTWWLTWGEGPPSPSAVIVVTCAENLFGGAITTATFAYMMSRVDRRIGATHYTVLATIEVLGKSPVSFFSGVMAEALGAGSGPQSYGPVFLLGAVLSLAFLPLLWPLIWLSPPPADRPWPAPPTEQGAAAAGKGGP